MRPEKNHSYVTSQFWQWELANGEYLRRPTSIAHAKQVGTTLTVCGRLADGWPRFWHLAFPWGDGENCPACFKRSIDTNAAMSEPVSGPGNRR
jgi:hypothetical protein